MSGECPPERCDRCKIECWPAAYGFRPLPGDEHFRDLCVELADPSQLDDLDKRGGTFGDFLDEIEVREVNCEDHVATLACVEYLAVYCPYDDMVYYNIDRIGRYIVRTAMTNLATLKKQIKEQARSLQGHWLFKNITPAEGVKVLLEATARAYLRFIIAHERYHWAAGPSGLQQDEEALATAWGLHTAYHEEYDRLFNGSSQHGIRVVEYVLSVRGQGYFRLVDFLILDVYSYVLTLARLGLIHYNLRDYSNFTKYLTPLPKTPRLALRQPVVEVDAGFFSFGFHIRYREINIDNLPSFTGVSRSRNDALREIWTCCERKISLKPNTLVVDLQKLLSQAVRAR